LSGPFSDVGDNGSRMEEVEGFSGESLRVNADVGAFAGLLSKIVIGDCSDQWNYRQSVPGFIVQILERGQSSDSKAMLSFLTIFEPLKRPGFRIMEAVDSNQVNNFVSWIELSEVSQSKPIHKIN
jgi:hypothetical protein